ncbi:MAG: thioredoxin family protein, partial [Planctomycetaceae bacterium]|nr:thioredoxin family protein [Planctomycetaceae bacterium]
NTPLVFLAYGTIGLGMASPYLIMGAFPEMLRFLPKPGQWMETFKKTMGFFLLVAVVWILYFIQIERLLPTVALLFALWYVCWKLGNESLLKKQGWLTKLITILILLAVIFFSFNLPSPLTVNSYTLENAMKTKLGGHTGKHWIPYEPEALTAALKSGKPVLVDFTADWCVNCKVLEQFVLYSDDVIKELDRKQAVSFMADCTREGAAKEFLRQFGADQVPVLAVFRPNEPDKPLVIRGGYTKKMLLDILAEF